MRILFIGDIFGTIGRRVLSERLQEVREEFAIDVCIANGENSAGGRGITEPITRKLHRYGVDIITGGNHSVANKDAAPAYARDPQLIRPLNFPPGNMGTGKLIYTLEDGRVIGIVNLMGRTFFSECMDCPFRIGKQALEELSRKTNILVVDFHAEASSEKIAFASYIDGMASAVLGTHTHVQTADERILARGTAFITDVGMTGPENSAIGMKFKEVLQKFLLQTHSRFEPASSGPMLNAVVMEIDDQSGKAQSIERILRRVTLA
jgi:metallophosphoesterase (TIGR00282 family)